jgi:hypothetical protein
MQTFGATQLPSVVHVDAQTVPLHWNGEQLTWGPETHRPVESHFGAIVRVLPVQLPEPQTVPTA